MKRSTSGFLLLPLFALTACATQPPPSETPIPAATRPAMGGRPGDTTAPAMERMLEMHGRMMADSVIHRHMMADPETRAMMREMMGGAQMEQMEMGQMQRMDPAMHRQMMTRMRERMQAMTPEQRQAMMERMRSAHQRMMADERVRERMMADPEMRRMTENVSPMQERMQQMGGMQHAAPSMQLSPADSAAVLAAADRFRQAITAGDRAAAEAVLLPEAVILESGGTETRTEYLSHHFVSDGAFLKAVTREPVTRSVQIAGDAAWISSVNRMHGNYRDRAVDVNSAELLVLRRTPAGWRVAAVHWSSRPRT